MSIALHYSFRKVDQEMLCHFDKAQESVVEQVYLKFCDLFAFPEWITRFRNLTHINISSNSIENFPDELGLIENLNYFDMSDNCFISFPLVLFELNNLSYLDVAGNYIETIPTGYHHIE